MPEEITQELAQTEEKVFDPKAFMEQRNSGAPATTEEKVAAKSKTQVKEEPKVTDADRTRSLRRQLNQALRENGELSGRLKALEEMQGKGKPPAEEKAAPAVDEEPKRENFSTDAEYNRAVGRWDSRQEIAKDADKRAKEQESNKSLQDLQRAIAESDKKAKEDLERFPDWEEVVESAKADDEQPEFIPSEHPFLMGRLATSDVKTPLLYHLAKHPAEMKKLLDLSNDLDGQARAISRLEGKVETLYNQKSKPAAQAGGDDKSPKTATHPAEGQPGRNSAERDARKPRPSSTTAVHGGSPAAETPVPGTKAWMEWRNAQTGGR